MNEDENRKLVYYIGLGLVLDTGIGVLIGVADKAA